MVTQTCNPRKRKTNAGRLGGQSQPGLNNDTMLGRDGGKEEGRKEREEWREGEGRGRRWKYVF